MSDLRDEVAREFREGVKSAHLRSPKEGIVRGVQTGVALAVAIFSPVVWWAKILIFLGIMFLIGLVVQYRILRRKRNDLAADALMEFSEASRRDAEDEARALTSIVRDVAGRIGEAPVQYNEYGEVSVHPDLARELDKPGNEGLREMLLMAGHAHATKARTQ